MREWRREFARHKGALNTDEERSASVELFRDFWNSKPSEELFGQCLSGVTIWPEFFHIMATDTGNKL